MDALHALLTDPASPRLTTYTQAGRMELSGQTLQNWEAKVANLLAGLGAGPGSVVLLDAEPGWQPVTIAIGAWLVGATVIDLRSELSPSIQDAPTPPVAAFTDSIDLAEQLAEEGLASHGGDDEPIEEIFVLSTDPFGRGITESGGDLPFGLNDYSPELRVQPDALLAPVASADPSRVLAASGDRHFTQADWQAAGGENSSPGRIVCGPWENTVELAEALLPWAGGGSVVMSTDSSPARLAELASKENGQTAV